MKLDQEVVESPCCKAPSTCAASTSRSGPLNTLRRCIQCRKTFFGLAEDFESEDEAAAVHRIRMHAARWLKPGEKYASKN